jgi:hypothetical protein
LHGYPGAARNRGERLVKRFGDVRAVDGDIAVVLGTAALLTALFAPLTNRRYRTRS